MRNNIVLEGSQISCMLDQPNPWIALGCTVPYELQEWQTCSKSILTSYEMHYNKLSSTIHAKT